MISVIRVSLVAFCLVAGSGAPPTASAGAGTQSIDLASGALDVDYPSYLSKHDVVFNQPVVDAQNASTVGNGRVGAMVWNEDGLRMQISAVDASEETAFSAGWIHLYTAPKMDASYSTFQQRLALYDGALTIKYDADRTVTVMGSPASEVIGIHVSDSRADVSGITLDLGIWDTRNLSGGDVPNIATWRSVSVSADARGIRLSRGQHDPNNFGYTLSARVQGAQFTTRLVDANTARIVIAPSADYTIWVACASRLNAPDHDSIGRAEALLDEVEAAGYRQVLSNYERWWHEFWRKSFVQYTDTTEDGDYLENLYYLYTYIIAAGSYGNYPFHFVNGAFASRGDANSTKWSVAYWHWNERDVYDSFLASNHPDMVLAFCRLYARNFHALVAQTLRRFGTDGIWVPETMGWDGSDRFTEASDYTKDILSTGAEVAENMYAEYEYTDDTAYLRSTVYPFLKGVAQFYTHELTIDAKTGDVYLPKSNALETYWDVKNAITDLAAVRSLFPVAIKTSRELRVDAALSRRWQLLLDHLAPYPVEANGSRYAPHDPPAAQSHNWQNVASELIWPFGVTGIGASDFARAVSGWFRRPYPYSNIWADDAIQAARLGLGSDAREGLKLMIRTYQVHPNGLTNAPAGEFEFLGTHLSTINESLLQSYNGKIRVFPAIPGDRGFTGRFTLLARGGFLVTSECQNANVEYVAIKSLYGNVVTLENPWGSVAVRIRRALDNVTILAASTHELVFHTSPNTLYLVERRDAPLSKYRHVRLRGTLNRSGKRLADSTATIGSFSTSGL